MNSRFYAYSLRQSSRYQSDTDAVLDMLEEAENISKQWTEVRNHRCPSSSLTLEAHNA